MIRRTNLSGEHFFLHGSKKLACIARKSQAFNVQRSAFNVQRLAFGVWRLAFNVQRLAFGVWRLGLAGCSLRESRL
jgi:hypothetical protein